MDPHHLPSEDEVRAASQQGEEAVVALINRLGDEFSPRQKMDGMDGIEILGNTEQVLFYVIKFGYTLSGSLVV